MRPDTHAGTARLHRSLAFAAQMPFSTLYPLKPKRKGATFVASFLFGAGDEARTRYLHLGKVALYRMSYTRISNAGIIITEFP